MKLFLNKKSTFLMSLMFLALFSSCVSNKKIAYFQFDEIDQQNVSNVYKTVFKPDDLLQITISSNNIEAVKSFNLPAVSFSGTSNSSAGQSQQLAYLIDSNGEIDFPVLGKLKIGGLTREETITLLKSKLAPQYVKKPTVNIRISNFKITVLGDVKNPGVFTVPNERITIVDAIGLAGDLNISGKRSNILVQREEGNKKVEYRVNLLSNKTLTSPVYYLQQNDVIIVEHNYARVQSASKTNLQASGIVIKYLVISL